MTPLCPKASLSQPYIYPQTLWLMHGNQCLSEIENVKALVAKICGPLGCGKKSTECAAKMLLELNQDQEGENTFFVGQHNEKLLQLQEQYEQQQKT